MIEKIGNTLSKISGRTGLVLQKHSPEILIVVGITGIVGSTIMACRATLKADEVIEKHNEKVEAIKFCIERPNDVAGLQEYTDTDHKRDMTVTYAQTAMDFILLYGPSVTLGVAGIACVIGAHGIMKKRNLALMAAYKAIEEGFSAYRKRIVEEYGEDKDYMFRHGLYQEKIDTMKIDDQGKAKKVKKEVLVNKKDPNNLSIYARWFEKPHNDGSGKGSRQWCPTSEYNLTFLKGQQNYWNDMLQVRGHVFLNEVYDSLGFERVPAGQVVGWVLGEGDGFIDFGMYNGTDRKSADGSELVVGDWNRDFINGYQNTVLLDFNVDGVVYEMI